MPKDQDYMLKYVAIPFIVLPATIFVYAHMVLFSSIVARLLIQLHIGYWKMFFYDSLQSNNTMVTFVAFAILYVICLFGIGFIAFAWSKVIKFPVMLSDWLVSRLDEEYKKN